MLIHLLGHACLIIETSDLAVLVDPVFVDPHAEGTAHIYPEREIRLDAVSKCGMIVITHRHFDHFDLRTLAQLPRSLPVLIPEDELMRKCLERLGFSTVETMASFRELQLGGTTLLTTASEAEVKEWGLVLADASGVFWNQVDTQLHPGTIDAVRDRFGRVDLFVAMWQPMLEFDYQLNRATHFPFDNYGVLLDRIARLQPGALAPGANGFRFDGASAWLDDVVFPISRERFCADVAEICPGLRDSIFALDPGDVLALEEGRCRRLAEDSAFVARSAAAPRPCRFRPVCVDGRLVDTNPDGCDPEEVERVVRVALAELGPFIAARPELFVEHRRWRVVHEIEVRLAEKRIAWLIDFTADPPVAREGSSPLANSFSYVTGSALFGIVRAEKGWDYAMMGGFYRRHDSIYRPTAFGLLKPTNLSIEDPLALLYPYEAVLEATIDKQLERLTAADPEPVRSTARAAG